MRCSTTSGSFMPPRAKILMPLSGAGLCDAETITPKSASMSAIRNAVAGVGRTPASSTSTPEVASPADDGGGEELAGDARVARDDGHGAATRRAQLVGVAALAEDDGGRLGQGQCEVGGEGAVGQAPHPVRAEEPGIGEPESPDQRFEY